MAILKNIFIHTEENEPETEVVFPLLSLPNVVVHHLVSFLDPETKLFLGATCTFLAKIVAKKVLTKNAALLSTMLEELPTMTKALVQAATVVISFGPELIQKRCQLLLIHQIAARFPSNSKKHTHYVAFNCPNCDLEKPETNLNLPEELTPTGLAGDEDHVVSWAGFLLLFEIFKEAVSCDLLPVEKVNLQTGWLKVADFIARQTHPVKKLSLDDVHCQSEEDGATLTGLIKKCQKWEVGTFRMTGDLGQSFWEDLAAATMGDHLNIVRVTKKVLKKANRGHLRKVWQSSKASWNVYTKLWGRGRCHGGDEEGWSKLEEVIDSA